MLLLAIGEGVAHVGEGLAAWWLAEPKYWVFPAQTVLCTLLLVWWWRDYRFATGTSAWRSLFIGVTVGLLALAVWVSPQWLFGAERRLGGFDLWFFGGGDAFKWNLNLRVTRLVIVVPLLEEIFWRGFLLRHLIRDPFHEVSVGTFSWQSFVTVSLVFGLAHWGPDFVPAIITGALYNLVAVTTRSLGACVLAHAVTNLGLGLYLFRTQQWGFW